MHVFRAVAVAAALAASAIVGPPTPAAAAGSEPGASGTTINVTAWVDGNFGGKPKSASNPCPSGSERVTQDFHPAIPAPTATRVVAGVTQTYYFTFCALTDPPPGIPTFSTITTPVQGYWSAPPSTVDLIPMLMVFVEDYINDPLVSWPNMSPTEGWLFVKVPMDYRVNNVAPISVTASPSNELGSVTATVTATPAQLSFDSGEGGSDTCTVSDGRMPYVPRSPGECAYTYQNSSSTASNGYAFNAQVEVTWNISSTPASASLPATLSTASGFGLPVSEVQAVVTCIGSDC